MLAVPEFPRPCLMLVTEPSEHLLEIVVAAVSGGVNMVQWREKRSPPSFSATDFETLSELREVTKSHACLIVNEWANLVRKVSADGVQLPERSFRSVAGARQLLSKCLVGVSIHSLETAQRAVQEGADYLVAGTIFPSASHPEISPQGVGYLGDVCRSVPIPVIAIGGIQPENVADCIEAGAAGVAVLSLIMRAPDPQAAARAYRMALDAAWEQKQCN